MKVKFLGVSCRKGVGKESGKPYEMGEFLFCREIVAKSTDNYEFRGFGFTEFSLKADPRCVDQFKSIKLGQEVEVKLEPQPDRPMFNWVVGLA